MPKGPVCMVVGAGAGNGRSIGWAFAEDGHQVALLARDAKRLEAVAGEVRGALPVACDVTDEASVQAAVAQVRERLGPPSVVVYNAGSGAFGDIDATRPADFEAAWRTNALGCLHVTRAVLGDLRAAKGALIIIGATASLKGGANFVAFASAKAALRSLAQSLARKLGPEGVHVAHVVIDGVIDGARTRALLRDKPDEYFMQADDIARSVLALARQPKSAWTFELDLRPFGESW